MKPICYLLCATLLVQATGCMSPMQRAGRYRALVFEGMSQPEVSMMLGEPDEVVEDGTGVMRIYRYESGCGFFYWTLVVLEVAILVPLVVLARSGGGDLFIGSPGEFRVHITREGRVDWISPVEAGE